MPELLGDNWKDWIEYADDDRAEAFLALKRGSWRDACFHAQQACEKLLKAFLIKQGVFIPVHDPKTLAQEASRYLAGLTLLLNRLDTLTKHYYASRYPDAARRLGVVYNRETAEECVKVMEELWRMLRGKVS